MSAVEVLVHTIAKARPDWAREDIRAAIADAVARPLHKLALDRATNPAELRDFIRRTLTETAAAALVSNVPPVVDVIDERPDPHITNAGLALARQALAAAKEK